MHVGAPARFTGPLLGFPKIGWLPVSVELHLARRYLLGLRRRTHIATVTLISMIGLGLGVLALVVTLSLLEGFQASIRSEIVTRATHARVIPADGRRLADPGKLASVLQEELPEVEMVEVVRGTCLVSSFTDAVPASVIGRSDALDVGLDRILANRLQVGSGEEISVISPRQRLTPMGPLPVRVRAEIARVLTPEPGSQEGSVRLPLGLAQRLLWGDTVVEAIELRDITDPWQLGDRVRSVLGPETDGIRVEGLVDLHRPLLLALAMERVMIFVAVGLMLVVAALNLLCNVAMVAAEKRVDLAVLSGIGLTPRALRRLFLLLGMGIGMVGSTLGAVLGVAISMLLNESGALPLPRGVFSFSSVPFRVEPSMVAVVMAVALALAAAASWLPSRMVALREPAEGLRYE
ncbi:MAG: ABC transporter permease [Acidobacteria bacterium]|uniref:ABC transporter permease n=1 Tax=Candidatus Sulfomarinibacter kjeldsenii TaxID=2885994 RepID=A0A8J6Y6C5_9BACT|nr:ABC transporter permease [Candidatus Sulfomarinibacter kjeldsenii]MBD3857602.1 ABC transporter permease [Candidatus Sulfomarinibacter kjeldsenii]MBD3870369.1 ABC transporter permease [Candidatus Sulfomarinibacter kjeldsenii]